MPMLHAALVDATRINVHQSSQSPKSMLYRGITQMTTIQQDEKARTERCLSKSTRYRIGAGGVDGRYAAMPPWRLHVSGVGVGATVDNVDREGNRVTARLKDFAKPHIHCLAAW